MQPYKEQEKEEMIKELSKDLCKCYGGYRSYSFCGFCAEGKTNYSGCRDLAESLVEKGYSKK